MSENKTKTTQNTQDIEKTYEEAEKQKFLDKQKHTPQMGTFGDRFLAFIMDVFIIMIASFVIWGIIGGFTTIAITQSNRIGSQLAWGMNLSGNVFSIVLIYLYFGWFNVNKGQTPGKMVMKLKVVKSEDLNYLTWGKVFIRDVIGRWVSSLAFFLGYLWYFMSPKRQCWHDTFAHSYVVKVDDKGDILMGGLDEYPKEPVKTFLPCGCFGLFWILLFFAVFTLMGALIATYGNNVSPGIYSEDSYYNTDFDSTYDYGPEGSDDQVEDILEDLGAEYEGYDEEQGVDRYNLKLN